jgi:hypothetical protein
MSLLALVNPESSVLWRVSFAIAAVGGAAVLLALRSPAPGRTGMTAYVVAIALYILIAILAIGPGIVTGIGLQTAPVRAEAVLLTVLVFAGVNVAWLLLFEDEPAQGLFLQQRSRPYEQGTPTAQAGTEDH